jgi:hypothetical protein
MRPLLICEVVLLARVLTRTAPEDRPEVARAILAETDQADAHMQATGTCHSRFGDGSLMSRCSQLSPPSEPMADDHAFLASLAAAALAIMSHSER